MGAFMNPAHDRDSTVAIVRAAHAAGLLVQGNYFDPATGKGSLFGVLLESGPPTEAADRFGMPAPFPFAADTIFNGLPRDRASSWAVELVEAIGERVDLSRSQEQLAIDALNMLSVHASGDVLELLRRAREHLERRCLPDSHRPAALSSLKVLYQFANQTQDPHDDLVCIAIAAAEASDGYDQIPEFLTTSHGAAQTAGLNAALVVKYTAKFLSEQARRSMLETTQDTAAALLAAQECSETVFNQLGDRLIAIVRGAPEDTNPFFASAAASDTQKPLTGWQKWLDNLCPPQPSMGGW